MRIFAPLRSAPMALLWGGLSFSAIGDQLYGVALTWIAVSVLGANAGYLTALQALVVLLSVLSIGSWTDRWDQQRGMIGADLVRAAMLAGVVALWLATGAPQAAALVGAVVVLALGEAVFEPALDSILPLMVTDTRQLPAANALLDATNRSARLIGPGLIALLASVLPVVHFLTLDALSFLASAAAVLAIRRIRPQATRPPAIERPPFWQGITSGVRAMTSHKLLGYVLATAWVVTGVWYAVFYLALPLMIVRHGGGTIGSYGLIISAYGCTNLAATLVVGSRAMPVRPQFQMFIGSTLTGSGIVLLGLADGLPDRWRLPGLLAAAALSAVGGPMKDIPVSFLRQTRLSRGDIPAATRAYMAVNYTGMLAAMLLTPSVIALAGVAPVIVVSGAILAGIAITGLIRHADWVEAAQPA